MLFSLVSMVGLLFYGLFFCRSRSQFLVISSVVLISVVASLFYGISNYFTGEGVTAAVIYDLIYGMDGFEAAGIDRFPGMIALVFMAMTILVLWVLGAWRQVSLRQMLGGKMRMPVATGLVVLVFMGGALLAHPMLENAIRLKKEFSISQDAYLLDDSVLWASDPDMSQAALLNVNMAWSGNSQGRSRKSIVYLYMESFERTYFDTKLFPGLTPELALMEKSGLTFHGIGQSPLSNWTIAGMVASQCGMPLAPISDVRNDYGHMSGFMPGRDCLGDLLHKSGYTLDYIGGADLDFSGKGGFYRRHGFTQVMGRDELRFIYGRDMPVHTWGAYDETVFDAARKRYYSLVNSGKPFGLFLLTTTTHPYSGFPGKYCDDVAPYGSGNNKMLNSVRCSDQQAAEFIKSLMKDAPDNVIFVVASDHFLVAGDSSRYLEENKSRENLFMVFGKNLKPQIINREATTLDIAPTVASLLGYPTESIGLGRNLLSSQMTLTEKFGREKFYSLIPGWRRSLRLNEAGHHIAIPRK